MHMLSNIDFAILVFFVMPIAVAVGYLVANYVHDGDTGSANQELISALRKALEKRDAEVCNLQRRLNWIKDTHA
jgi:hypothetical protein